jgi:hypothetical protein
MDKKTFSIGILLVSAVILFVANYFLPQSAQGMLTIKDRGYSMLTATSQNGGEVVYVVDNVSGRFAVFAYDPSKKELVPRVAGEMMNAFVPPGR